MTIKNIGQINISGQKDHMAKNISLLKKIKTQKIHFKLIVS